MASHRDQLIGLDRQGMDGARITEARSGLTEAVTELQRLTRGPLFSAMPRVLADLDNAPRGSSVSVETVRMLRQCSAEHLRVADELEVAARRCRLVEEEIGQRIDALLAGWDRQPDAPRQHDPGASSATARGAIGLRRARAWILARHAGRGAFISASRAACGRVCARVRGRVRR